MRFVMLVPNSLDPATRAQKLPVPDERPSEKIATLYPQTDPQKDVKNGARPAQVSATATGKDSANGPAAAKSGTSGSAASKPVAQAAAAPVPLPAARPHIEPVHEGRRHRQLRRYRTRQ
jgi:membrane-bound lytic murein transglycosylase A